MSVVHFLSWMSLLCLCFTSAEQECVQQRTAEQIVHVPVPQIQEHIVESIQVIPAELFPERIEEQIMDSPVPASAEEITEVVQIIPQHRFQQRTVGATPGPVIDYETPSPVIEYIAPAPSVTSSEQFSPTPWKPSPLVSALTPPGLVNPQCSFTAAEAVEIVRSASHEREQLQPVKQSVHTHHRPDEIVEAAACECARKRPPTKSNVRSITVYGHSSVRKRRCGCLRNVLLFLPHELQKLRSHIQSGKDAMADAVRDLYECRQQLKRRRS